MTCADSGVQWGDVATWVSGLATLLTLIFIWRSDRSKSTRAQASRIVLWDILEPQKHEVHLLNNSDQPIHSVAVSLRTDRRTWTALTFSPVKQGETHVPGFIMPGQEYVAAIKPQAQRTGSPPVVAYFWRAEVQFTDGSGRRWTFNLRTRELRKARSILRTTPFYVRWQGDQVQVEVVMTRTKKGKLSDQELDNLQEVLSTFPTNDLQAAFVAVGEAGKDEDKGISLGPTRPES